MAATRRITRRNTLKLAASATALPLVHIRTAGAAGKLTMALWDHWVPEGNKAMQRQINAWSEKSKVEVQADFITSNGFKLQLTAAAEAQAKTGHDIMAFLQWDVHNYSRLLHPVDDVMKRLTDKFGPTNDATKYLAVDNGHWHAVPTSSGTLVLPACARISVLKNLAGIDVQKMFPAKPGNTAEADTWTYDTFLKAAEACHKGGMTFAMGLGQTTDSVNAAAALFAAFGAELVDAKGNIQLKTDAMRQALEYAQKLVKFLPPDAASFDDASNNRALISGKSALIFNPPSAWAVAKRDAPAIAQDCWTFPNPMGPKGRYVPYQNYFWGTWNFSQNKTAAGELIEYLMQREQVEQRDIAVDGYDLPPFASMVDFKVWSEVEPPKGTVFNYPIQPWHKSTALVAAAPAPPNVAVQIYNRGTAPTMLAKLQSGQSIPQVIAWAQDELEGFTR